MAGSEIRLLENVDIKSDYKNTFTFPNLQAQISFFTNKAVRTLGQVSYIRKANQFRFDGNVEEIRNVSYLMYQNPDFENKWFFAFVDQISFVSPNVANIDFTIDVMQTWKFEIEYKTCMVEREHVANDTIGEHTLQENINVGEIITAGSQNSNSIKDLIYIFVATEFLAFPPETPSGDIYAGVYSGLWYFGTDDITTLDTWIAYYNQAGKIETLITIFTMPKALVDIGPSGVVLPSSTGKFVTETITKNYSSLDGYVPKNNKLFVYPYNYLEVTNNQGQSNIYHYELFNTSSANFYMTSNIAPSPTVYLQPLSYRNQTDNLEEFITLSDYPLSPWAGDVYATWLAQNQVSNALKIGGSVAATLGGAFTGNIPAVVGGAAGLLSSIGSFAEQSIRPDKSAGSSSGGANIARGAQVYTFLKKTIRAEYAKIIDDFFTMYGYKVNELKVPNFETRPHFNYLKLNEANVFGNFNNEHLLKIRSILETGITFWHTDNVGNYSLNNAAPIGGGSLPDPEPEPEPEPVETFAFPLPEGTWSLTSPYGMRTHPITGEWSMHYGVDLGAPEGTNILSVMDATVTSVGFSSSMGNYIYTEFEDQGQTYTAIHMHMRDPASLSVGQTVLKGDVIGYVGSTGDSTGNHLHFGLKENGSYVDPWPYLGGE